MKDSIIKENPVVKKIKNILPSTFMYVFLIVFALFALIPFFFLLISSFKPGVEVIQNGINTNFQFELMNLKNYGYLFTENDGLYLHWYKNSIIITALFTVLTLFFSSAVGYGLAVYYFKGKKLLFILILLVMMLPVEILILPLYKLSTNLNLIDSIWGVILPFVVSPFSAFFFRQYTIGIPKDFLDAARIDGCTEYGIFFSIMMPLMKPAFGAITILSAMQSWNNFVWPLIVLRNDENLTLPIGIASMITPYGNNYDMIMSGAVLSVIPILIVFLINQKVFIRGLTLGGVKG